MSTTSGSNSSRIRIAEFWSANYLKQALRVSRGGRADGAARIVQDRPELFADTAKTRTISPAGMKTRLEYSGKLKIFLSWDKGL